MAMMVVMAVVPIQFTVAINFKLAKHSAWNLTPSLPRLSSPSHSELNWEKRRDMVMILKIFATQKR